jgi:hypothetical protein
MTASLLKISRIYNSTRLGLISLFHQVCYSYSVGSPIGLIVFQGPPCIHESSFGSFQRLLPFPSVGMFAGILFTFSMAHFSGITSFLSKLIIIALFFVIAITEVGLQEASFFQDICAILIGYILHFVSLRIPFRWMHGENIILTVFVLVGLIAGIMHGWTVMQSFSEMWFSFVVIGIDELIIERPLDINWVVESSNAETIRLLDSEDEAKFQGRCRSDMITSVVAFSLAFVGVLIRFVLEPTFFYAPT